MRISNSKKQLAKIIHENGGWRDGAEWAAQDSKKDAYPCRVCFYSKKPAIKGTQWRDGAAGMVGDGNACIEGVNQIPNWHQTILSRDEYFHLYPAQVGVVIENKTTCHLTVADKPTIEQLAAEYRNAKDYADRKQQEADAAKADADVKLAELVAAGEALGLVLSVAAPEPDVCADGWVEYDGGGCPVDANEVVEVFLRRGRPSLDGPKAAHKWDWSIEAVEGDIVKWRRVKGDSDA